MIDFWFPKWIKGMLVNYADNRQLSTEELEDLRRRLKRFDVENPLVSIVIPAWNEEENITKTIASLAYNEFDFPCELFVVNNNSTDNTQAVLDNIGVRSMMELNQGIASSIIRSFKSKKTEARRVMGFNFGLNREVALEVNGFIMDKPRKFRNELGTAEYVGNSEDGMMASAIKKSGYKILYVNNRKSRVWTSDRRLQMDGGLLRASMLRLLKMINRKAFDKIAKS